MSGLVIFPGGWPLLADDLYKPDPDDELAEVMWRICRVRGHQEHTCPACGDKSCLRCKVGLNG